MRTELDAALAAGRAALAERGVEIDGYSGGSPEGEVWQYSFRQRWPIGHEMAGVSVQCYWGDRTGGMLDVTAVAEVFSTGAPSRLREQWTRSMEAQGADIGKIVGEYFDRGADWLSRG